MSHEENTGKKTLQEYLLTFKSYTIDRAERGYPEMPTGLSFIDRVTDGIHKGEIWIIAGKSGMGKTCLALMMAREIADRGNKVLYISLEMKAETLTARLFCQHVGISFHDYRIGNFPPNIEKLEDDFFKWCSGIQLEVVPYGYTYEEIEKIIMSYYPTGILPDIIFIDFAQYIASEKYQYNDRIALQEYTRRLQEFAKRKDVAIVLISQLRRLPSGADYNREPDMMDLKGSSSLEQLATVVLLLYQRIEEENGIKTTQTFLKVAKNRFDEKPDMEIIYNGNKYRYEEIDYDNYKQRKDTDGF